MTLLRLEDAPRAPYGLVRGMVAGLVLVGLALALGGLLGAFLTGCTIERFLVMNETTYYPAPKATAR